MDVSVILCTYNRCGSLRRTLETFRQLQAPDAAVWELLVVDNKSPDATREVCSEFASVLPLRYLFEPQQGKSHALNAAIRATEAKVLVFTDDDVDVDARWLAELWQAVQGHPDATIFGGKIVPTWESRPPRWFAEHATDILRSPSVSYDRGPEPRVLGPDEVPFFGANMALRREVFADGVAFRTDLGPSGEGSVRGEEAELIGKLRRLGHKAFYVPTAVIFHRTPRERMTERYLRLWYKGAGIESVRRGYYADTERKWLGAPGYLWKQLFLNARIYAITRYTCPAFIWLPAEVNLATAWGAITEFRRRPARQA